MDKRNKTSNKRKGPDSPTLSPKPKRKLASRSMAWEIFSRLKDNDNKCSCNYCGKIYSCNPGSGTTTMNVHKWKCKPYLDHLESHSQNVLVSSDGRTSDRGNNGAGMIKPFDQTVCRRATVKMIIMDELPFLLWRMMGFNISVRWLSLGLLFHQEE